MPGSEPGINGQRPRPATDRHVPDPPDSRYPGGMVMDPNPAPPPPPTIAFLRDTNRIDAVLLSCNRCAAAQPMPWADLNLPDDTPFPAIVRSRVWQCQRCESTDIGAMPDWRSQRPAVEMAPKVLALVLRRNEKAPEP